MAKIIIYTDGSSLRNGVADSYCGWAYKMLQHGEKPKLKAGSCTGRTNNEMEMLAVIHALRDIKDKHTPVEVRSDSSYVVSTIRGFQKVHKNRHLWALLFSERAKFEKIEFEWVRGHFEDKHNKDVDMAARQTARYAQQIAEQRRQGGV